jgi:hypothetical protein
LEEHFTAGSRSRHVIHKPLDSFSQFLIPRRRQQQADLSPATVYRLAGCQKLFLAAIQRQVTIASEIAVDSIRTLLQVGRFAFAILIHAIDCIGQEGLGLAPNGALRRIRSNAH